MNEWSTPPNYLSLGRRDIDVWLVDLDLRPEKTARLVRYLSPDERERAGRFQVEPDRLRFIAARGILRLILGSYLRADPMFLRFAYNEFGKPDLSHQKGSDALRFNVSHSEGLCLIAVTRGRRVGIDLERIRPEKADGKAAEKFFSRAETAALRALPKVAQVEAFFSCWTRKEAFIKARGQGLSLPLDQFEVSVGGGTAALLHVNDEPKAPEHWGLCDLAAADDFAAALAAEGKDWRLRLWRYPG